MESDAADQGERGQLGDRGEVGECADSQSHDDERYAPDDLRRETDHQRDEQDVQEPGNLTKRLDISQLMRLNPQSVDDEVVVECQTNAEVDTVGIDRHGEKLEVSVPVFEWILYHRVFSLPTGF